MSLNPNQHSSNNIHDLTYIFIKILAIFLVLSNLNLLLGHITGLGYGLYNNHQSTININITIIFAALSFTPIIIAIILWLMARRLALYLYPINTNTDSQSILPKSIAQIIFSATGLLIIAIYLPKLITSISPLINIFYNQSINYNYNYNQFYINFLNQLIGFLIGLFILIKPKTIIKRLKYFHRS